MKEITTSTKRIYDGKILNLRVDTVILPDGKSSSREIVEHHGAVAIVPAFEDKTVLLVSQYRQPAEQVLLEIPAGSMNPGETPEECAGRELTEETQYGAEKLTKLFQMYVAPGYSTEVIHVFLAEGLQPKAGKGDDDEFLEITRLPIAEALDKISAGEIQDAKTISGLLCVERLWNGHR